MGRSLFSLLGINPGGNWGLGKKGPEKRGTPKKVPREKSFFPNDSTVLFTAYPFPAPFLWLTNVTGGFSVLP